VLSSTLIVDIVAVVRFEGHVQSILSLVKICGRAFIILIMARSSLNGTYAVK